MAGKMEASRGSIRLFTFCSLVVSFSCGVKYVPTWESLDSRPLPLWYDEAKLGIFLHFGVFSVPSFDSEWFWERWQTKKQEDVVKFMKDNYKPDFTYADFATQLTTEFFNPEEWADIFESSGARYVVLTSKHHEGFTNWPSNHSFNWNSMDVGPKRDIVGELASAVRSKPNLTFGLYHSLFEWFHPLFLKDQANNFTTNYFVKSKTLPELYEIVNTYQPELIWSDGDWLASDNYWEAKEFLAWLYNDSLVSSTEALVLYAIQWLSMTDGELGIGAITGDITPVEINTIQLNILSLLVNSGKLQKHKFENAMTIDRYSWGFRRNANLQDYLTIEELLKELVTTVSCGGNLLMNLGPTKDGRIVPIFQERLRQMGQWMSVNGEAIYSSRPWTYQNDTKSKDVWYTSKKDATGTNVYAISLGWPDGHQLTLGAPEATVATTVSLLGYPGHLSWARAPRQGLVINIPIIPYNKIPCQGAFTFKITGLAN